MTARPRLLFLCTGNSVRSQMAEGWARHLAGNQFEVFSAGTAPACLNPSAVAAMKEKGLDISRQRSKSLGEVPGEADYVISLCAQVDAACPTLPARRLRLAWHLPDPVAVSGSAEEKLDAFRAVRDEIERRLRDFLARVEAEKPRR
ncbi:MAG: arsenate reductase ArsC [Terriglobia bacterium]